MKTKYIAILFILVIVGAIGWILVGKINRETGDSTALRKDRESSEKIQQIEDKENDISPGNETY